MYSDICDILGRTPEKKTKVWLKKNGVLTWARMQEIFISVSPSWSDLPLHPSLPFSPHVHIIIIVSRTWGAGEVIMSFYLHPAWPFLQTTCHWLPSGLGPDDIFWSGLSGPISGEWQVMDTQWQTKSPGGRRVGRTCQVSIRLASQWGCLLTVPPGSKSDQRQPHGCLEIGC